MFKIDKEKWSDILQFISESEECDLSEDEALEVLKYEINTLVDVLRISYIEAEEFAFQKFNELEEYSYNINDEEDFDLIHYVLFET